MVCLSHSKSSARLHVFIDSCLDWFTAEVPSPKPQAAIPELGDAMDRASFPTG